jgi:hypothetical protein
LYLLLVILNYEETIQRRQEGISQYFKTYRQNSGILKQ